MNRRCRVCGSRVSEFLDMGRQPMANGFLLPSETADEFHFRLAVGSCDRCSLVQLVDEVPAEMRYHGDYRYHASGSDGHRRHFADVATQFLEDELTERDPFLVEIGCNDGVMLSTIARAGVRHLGVDPATTVTRVAREKGVSVRNTFFDETSAAEIHEENGPADVVFGANTISHIGGIGSVLRGVRTLLSPDGVFVFEEPYLGTIVEGLAFDQIYDEHVLYFSVTSVQVMAELFGFDLVDARRTPLHGGQIRYTLARRGTRAVRSRVADLLAEEHARGLSRPDTLASFGQAVGRIRDDLRTLLGDLRAEGRTVVGYGAPGKCATVTNYCGIGTDLVPFVCDSTPAKQGRLVPGSHLPVRPPEAFADPFPDHALLFAWNHAEEIMRRERDFTRAGGRWITYVPEVRVS
ncbi:SAM-dependent methyltransferase [Actinoalloteichus sp. AHMU CJ021]|uniref:class I SAM-dependent methyltransferase n=1 Tax=Actinoalloteichus sp. AHMU CJ021 TaxID=2072503 RepID=UPI000CA05F9F|nr:SAM-dependent methyltransferase [Actinoalloteichus sp. AHMU CJ021]